MDKKIDLVNRVLSIIILNTIIIINPVYSQNKNNTELDKLSNITNNTSSDFTNNPHIYLVADLIGNWGLTKNKDDLSISNLDSTPVRSEATNSFFARAMELGFFGDVDYWGRGTANFHYGYHRGSYEIELEELFFDFTNLPYNFKLKLGKMRLDIGRTNSIHEHDWRFTTTPLVIYELLDYHSITDFGGELSVLMPYNFYQELKIGIFNGQEFGEKDPEQFLDPNGLNYNKSEILDSHVSSTSPTKKPNPLLTARIKNFAPLPNLPSNSGIQIGFSYLRYNVDVNPKNYWQMGGMDITLKREKGRQSNLEWGYEFWYRKEEHATDENADHVHTDVENVVNTEITKTLKYPQIKYGHFMYLDYRFNQIWNVGFKIDQFFQEMFYNSIDGTYLFRKDNSQSIWFSLVPSEFSRYRFTVERQNFYNQRENLIFYFQATFFLGFHPPHRY